MALEVDFITLGDASERLNVPSATLRHWTDQLEDFEVHYVMRNNRNERIYYDTDLEIFSFLRDLKAEYGRRTTTKDLASMISDKGREGEFLLRNREDAPTPQSTNRTADLLGQEDIKRLMDSDRVKQFMSIVVNETTKNIKEDLKKDLDDEFMKVNRQIVESHERLEKTVKEREERLEQRMAERAKQTDEYIALLREKDKRPWWKKIFS
jgi:DNA-binding transcriptional MerR regulator